MKKIIVCILAFLLAGCVVCSAAEAIEYVVTVKLEGTTAWYEIKTDVQPRPLPKGNFTPRMTVEQAQAKAKAEGLILKSFPFDLPFANQDQQGKWHEVLASAGTLFASKSTVGPNGEQIDDLKYVAQCNNTNRLLKVIYHPAVIIKEVVKEVIKETTREVPCPESPSPPPPPPPPAPKPVPEKKWRPEASIPGPGDISAPGPGPCAPGAPAPR